MLAALAVLLVVGGAAVAGLLALRADERAPVLVAVRDIAVGEEITADDLTTAQVAAEGTLLVPADRRDEVVGQRARVSISSGQLVDTSMLTQAGALREGTVAVGAALPVGRVPASGLLAGDIVQLVQVAEGDGEVVVAEARVSSAFQQESGGVQGGATVATFIVDEDDGARVAGVAAAGELAAVLVRADEPLED